MTVILGTNIIVGTNPDRIVAESLSIVAGNRKVGRLPELWDGKAAMRIVAVLADLFDV